VASLGKFNNDSFIGGSIGANDPTGFVRFGQNAFMGDGTRVVADRVKIGGYTSVDNVATNRLYTTLGSTIRGSLVESVALPLDAGPFCAFDPFVCGGDPVVVPAGAVVSSLAPGTYGMLQIYEGGILRLPEFGTYTFCSIRMSNNSILRPSQQVTINVAGDVKIGSGSLLVTESGAPFILNVSGRLVRISQGTVVNASINAPNAKIKIQRDGTIVGCTCSSAFKTDKHITLLCGGGSPSGAFVDP
jgi:hypothetical protein